VASPPIDVPVHATEAAVIDAPAHPAAAAGEAGDAARKPRRRRGGRNRRREGGAEAVVGAAANGSDAQAPAVANEASRAVRGERRPPRERAAADASSNGSRPSRQVAVTSGHASGKPSDGAASVKKPGLLSRLTRLFTGR
jgi:ATP-dependent RNA helicase RhlB